MSEVVKANYYALMIAILTGETACQSLKDMGFVMKEDEE